MKEFSVELKVCEGCGGLWLRARGRHAAYCTSCAKWLAEFPPPDRPNARSEAQRKRRQRIRATGGSRGLQAPETGVGRNGALALEVVK